MQTVLGGGDGFDIRTSVSGDNDLNTSVPVYLYHCGADNCTSVSGDDGFNTPVPHSTHGGSNLRSVKIPLLA